MMTLFLSNKLIRTPFLLSYRFSLRFVTTTCTTTTTEEVIVLKSRDNNPIADTPTTDDVILKSSDASDTTTIADTSVSTSINLDDHVNNIDRVLSPSVNSTIATPVTNYNTKTELEIYLDSLLNKPYFAFLHNFIVLNKSIRNRLDTEFPLVYKEGTKTHYDNFIFCDQNKVRYINENEWNKLYKDLTTYKEVDFISHEEAFQIAESIYDVAFWFCYDFPTLLSGFHYITRGNLKFIEGLIHSGLQKFLYKQLRKKGDLERRFDFGLTNLCNYFGELIFKELLHKSDIFMKFCSTSTIILETTLLLINHLLKAILTKDEDLIENIFLNMFYTNMGKAMRDLLCNFLLYHCCLKYSMKELPGILQVTLHPYWEMYHDRGILFLDLEAKLTKSYVQIGSSIINLLKNVGLLTIYNNKDIVNQTEQYRVQFDDHLITYFVKNLNFSRPFLVQNNLSFIRDHVTEFSAFQLILDNYDNLVHTNPDIDLKLTADCYLKTYRPDIKLTIDRQYLKFFLNYLDNLSTIPVNGNNISYFKDILEIYNVDSVGLKKLYDNSSSKERMVLDEILKFALNLNIRISGEISKSFKSLEGSQLAVIRKIYNKIFNNKLFFIGLLQEVTLYSMYGYFIANTFIDTRGRLYLHGYHLNIQNFPFGKTFIKPFNFNTVDLIQANYSFIQDAFQENLKNKTSKEAVRQLSFDAFRKKQDYDHISYLYKFFNYSKLTREDLYEYLSTSFNAESCLDFVRNFKKESENLFFVHSCILLHKNPSLFISNYYDLDASASGLQMTAILLQKNGLAEICNLIGKNKIDIYAIAANNFEVNINSFKQHVDSFKTIFNLSTEVSTISFILNDTEYDKLSLKSLQEKWYALLSSNWEISYKIPDLIIDICALLTESFENNINIKSLDKFEWILNPYMKNLMKYVSLRHVNKVLLKYLLIIYKGIMLFNALAVCDWISRDNLLFKRDLFKKAIMTYGYNSTFKGRTDYYITFFKEYAPENIDITAFINSKIKSIAICVEYYFELFRMEYLNDCETLRHIAPVLSHFDIPITINNKFFNIKIQPTKIQRSIVNIKIETKRRVQLTIKHRSVHLDLQSIRTGFPPNFIHSMDAYVVHLQHELIFNINKYFHKKGINLYLSFFTTHDQFMMLFTPFLDIIIKESYITLIASDYITTLKNNIKYKDMIEKYFSTFEENKKEFILQMEIFNPNYMK